MGQEGLFDLFATVGFYTVLAGMLKSLDVPLDPDIAAELAQTPAP